jgi:hypothetical protein
VRLYASSIWKYDALCITRGTIATVALQHDTRQVLKHKIFFDLFFTPSFFFFLMDDKQKSVSYTLRFDIHSDGQGQTRPCNMRLEEISLTAKPTQESHCKK